MVPQTKINIKEWPRFQLIAHLIVILNNTRETNFLKFKLTHSQMNSTTIIQILRNSKILS